MKRLNAQRRYQLLSVIALVCAFVTVVFTVFFRNPHPDPLIGMVRKSELRLAPEVGGRLKEIKVQRAGAVVAGDTLAILDSPEIDAVVEQSRRALEQAEAARARVYAGVRAEEVASAEKSVEKARSNLDFATAQHRRALDLVRTEAVSQQVLDTRVAELSSAASVLAATEAALAQAKAGPTPEDRQLADRTVELAQAALGAALKHQEKLIIRAPVDGSIWNVTAEIDEVVIPGQPVVTLKVKKDLWFNFNIREDMLNGIDVGTVLHLLIGNGQTTTARVSEIRPLGDFATWHAERAIDSHDLITFQVRADYNGSTERDLEPGMTVWITKAETPRK